MTDSIALTWCEEINHPDWELWDGFLQETPRGHYLQLSDWLKSYSVYGFSPALLLGKNSQGQIVGGLGIVKASFAFVKLFVVPVGPIVMDGWEETTELFVREFYHYCKKNRATYAHINLPILKEGTMQFSLPKSALPSDSVFYTGKEGIRFKSVVTISGLRWVDLTKYTIEDSELLLKDLPSKTRRDIRASLRKKVSCIQCSDHHALFQTYKAIERFASENGYVVRPWADVSGMLTNLFNKGYSIFLFAEKDNEIKGGIWLVKCGKRFTYMTGGTKREKPDLLTGYLLQWNALLSSLSEGFDGYDISVGGPRGVVRFKNSFNPVYYPFISPRHWVFHPLKFRLFDFLYAKLAKHKRSIASILRHITRK